MEAEARLICAGWLLAALLGVHASGQSVLEPLPPTTPAQGPPLARGPFIPGLFAPLPPAPGGRLMPRFDDFPGANAWLRVDYLNFHVKGDPFSAPLLTTSEPADAGRIGAPSTSVLFGARPQNLGAFSGVRITGGCWFTRDPVLGAEFSVFVLPGRKAHFQAASNQAPSQLLALPFVNETSGAAVQDSIILAQPGISNGGATATSSSSLWGLEANALRRWDRGFNTRPALSLLGGVRFLQLNERFDFGSASSGLGGVNRGDEIHTLSSFIGVQIGARAVRRLGRFSLEVTGKTGLGATNNQITLAGHANAVGFGSPQFLVLPNGNPTETPADISHNFLYAFSVLPEVQARLNYDWRPRLRLSAGYDFLYWTRLVRPGDQIDTRANLANATSALAAPIQPVPLDRTSDFWLRGWSLSLTYHY